MGCRVGAGVMAAAAVMLAAAVAHAGSATGGGRQRPLVSAFYFGDWHVDPQMSALHGAGWTEFDIVPHARPRFPGLKQCGNSQENSVDQFYSKSWRHSFGRCF